VKHLTFATDWKDQLPALFDEAGEGVPAVERVDLSTDPWSVAVQKWERFSSVSATLAGSRMGSEAARAKRACPQDGSLRLSMLQSDRSHGVFVFDPVDFSDAKGQPHRNGSVGLWPV
jgi:hypothetical protein